MKIKQQKVSEIQNSTKFVLEKNNEIIGRGYIIKREINPIEVYIVPEHQSNGYGKYLFAYLFNQTKNKGNKALFFELSEDQTRFRNIIVKHGALEVGKNGNKTKYVLKI